MQACLWLETAKVVLKNTYTRILNKHHHGVLKTTQKSKYVERFLTNALL